MEKIFTLSRGLLIAALVSGVAGAGTGGNLAPGNPRITPVVQAVHKALPTVVNISTEQIVRVADPFAAYFDEYFSGPPRYLRKTLPLGSGVIVDDSGLVLTNYHVIRRASNIEVALVDNQSFPGRMVAFDSTNDLALLQLQRDTPDQQFSAIEFARPDDVLLGETVVAVGNPFGLGHSVTTGVLSAENRSIREGDVVFSDILQTDAAINPGNSGGPLINLEGHLIGLNLAIRRDAEGIGFAVPLRRIEDVLAAWLVPSRFSAGICGFVPGTVERNGALAVTVAQVLPGGPAASAGLAVGDEVHKLNGQEVTHALNAGRILWRLKAGELLTVERSDGSTVSYRIPTMNEEQLIRGRLGIQVQDLTKDLRKALGLPATLRGVAISEVLASSPFASAEVGRGDIIFRIGNHAVASQADLWQLISQLNPGDPLDVFLAAAKVVHGEVFLKQSIVRVTLH